MIMMEDMMDGDSIAVFMIMMEDMMDGD